MSRKTLATVSMMVLALGLCSAALSPASAQYRRGNGYGSNWRNYNNNNYSSSAMVEAGTPLTVRLDSEISTEHAQRGDSWTGTVSQDVVSGDRVMIPAGSSVSGIVTTAEQGTHNSRPMIGLAVRRINVDGRWRSVNADAEPVVAGSNRARKIGAIAGGAAAGALLGHTVARGNHGTLIGGLLGGAAGYGLTRHAFRTMQLKAGTEMTFTVRQDVAMRR